MYSYEHVHYGTQARVKCAWRTLGGEDGLEVEPLRLHFEPLVDRLLNEQQPLLPLADLVLERLHISCIACRVLYSCEMATVQQVSRQVNVMRHDTMWWSGVE